MNRSGVRSFALFSALIAFALLLAGGGPRLIGHAEGYHPELIDVSVPLPAALSQAPQRSEETGVINPAVQMLQRRVTTSAQREACPPARVISDANGNVLRCQSYLHTVYQAFSLGDGFV